MLDFEGAVDRHQRKVFSFACYWLGDREEAADVTQEVLIRMWRHWQSIRTETLGAWLTRTTRNACIDRMRSRRVRNRHFVRPPEGEELEVASAASAGQPDPEAAVRHRELRRSLTSAIRDLREPHRSVVILREIQGLSYREISAALELPLNTVKVYLHRGRRALREALGDPHAD